MDAPIQGEKQPLEDAVASALALMDRDQLCQPLVNAFQLFTERRFSGGADLVAAVHEARSNLMQRSGTVAQVAPNDAARYDSQTISDAARHSAPRNLGRLLYCLVRSIRPSRLIELGTNLGVSAAYMAAALHLNTHGRLVTIDFSRPRLILAAELISNLGLNSVEFVHGSFDAHLTQSIASLRGVDFAFVDGDHQRDSTVRYFDTILAHIAPGGVIVFDDIRWSAGMAEAWTIVSTHPGVHCTFDLGRVGLVLVK
jgi:predicted O-methyltransferase YrrM